MIRWITDKLGTAAYSDAINISEDFVILDVRNLVDKEGNTASEVKSKIDEGVALLHNGNRVVVCCDYGKSRSNSIAAGILSVSECIRISDAVRKVMLVTGESEIKIEMLQSIYNLYNTERSQDSRRHILVTGASGFIGSELLRRMDDFDLIALSSKDLDLSRDHVLLDLLVKEHHIDTIVHLANPRIYTTYDAFGKSLIMLKTVLDVCASNNVHLVFCSTWNIYNGYKGSILANENLKPVAKDSYGHAKMLSENLIESYIENKGLSVFVLRLCSIYGIGKDVPKFIWNFIDKCRRNEDIITHRYLNGSPRLDLLHIHDVVDAIEIAVRSNDVGVYNIGGGISVSTEEVAKILVAKTGADSKISYSLINDYTANITMDSSKFSAKYGWHPKISLEAGLDELLNWNK